MSSLQGKSHSRNKKEQANGVEVAKDIAYSLEVQGAGNLARPVFYSAHWCINRDDLQFGLALLQSDVT